MFAGRYFTLENLKYQWRDYMISALWAHLMWPCLKNAAHGSNMIEWHNHWQCWRRVNSLRMPFLVMNATVMSMMCYPGRGKPRPVMYWKWNFLRKWLWVIYWFPIVWLGEHSTRREIGCQSEFSSILCIEFWVLILIMLCSWNFKH